ncbi:hypothetical protein EJ05DRAFT_477417 [Pseudovirgaria hyperparasitica]|uniref:Small ribosomal subunit protein mS41 n=1 Tax=Pseudovirgaria hyperparasitica TaxID=470096 RepID=A0A6A6W5I2_9PEZI|nr:uncharacterized protein EJ05DRAFT_477417 [Pseudovirgaria hyperparasitica]KAF2757200.1 hypothetical protein EJ05DRAFT_477417 [Pseudovirgaria hyperparasitica]
MILRTFTLPIRACFKPSVPQQCVRNLHYAIPTRSIPKPTPFIPDAATFLKVIGRGLSQYTSKFESWEALFSMTSKQMKEIGIEPPRARRYLLQWRERFRNGEHGVGSDIKHVKDGVAYFRLIERNVKSAETDIATGAHTPGKVKVAANVPHDQLGLDIPVPNATTVKGFKVKNLQTLSGPHLNNVAGTGGRVAKIEAKEGLWEIRRGSKVDGGERRRKQVRYNRQKAINRAKREEAGVAF